MRIVEHLSRYFGIHTPKPGTVAFNYAGTEYGIQSISPGEVRYFNNPGMPSTSRLSDSSSFQIVGVSISRKIQGTKVVFTMDDIKDDWV